VTINARGVSKTFELLGTNEFNSTRKRMSVVVRTPEGKIILYCKGADTVMYQRLASNQDHSSTTMKHLEDYASDGLRTLCFAMREIPLEEYNEWSKIYEQASLALSEREKKLEAAAEVIETNLILLGASAIEDKLQDNVPESIATLRQASIKVWMLTGDKQETAINIGFSCKLLTRIYFFKLIINILYLS